MTPQQILHHARAWIENEDDLRHLVPDPHGWRDVVLLMNAHYPQGMVGFSKDIQGRRHQRPGDRHRPDYMRDYRRRLAARG